jgi:hypothetical protein
VNTLDDPLLTIESCKTRDLISMRTEVKDKKLKKMDPQVFGVTVSVVSVAVFQAAVETVVVVAVFAEAVELGVLSEQ